MARRPKPPTTRPYTVGLTGGIASGKSTVAALFAALGVPVIDTDDIARAVVAPGEPLLARIVERFGREVLAPDGGLDRRKLRDRIFADERARLDLEAMLHPAIWAEVESRSRAAGGAYQMFAIPLLTETNAASRVDRVLLVDCDEELQIRRLQARDGSTREEAKAILASQASRAARRAIAHDVIVNDGSIAAMRDEVERLHGKYRRLAAEPRSSSERTSIERSPPSA